MTPCLDKTKCGKNRCDAGCRTCNFYVPSKGSRLYYCLAPGGVCRPQIDIQITQRTNLIKSKCDQCAWRIPSTRRIEDGMTNEQRYGKRHPGRRKERSKIWKEKNRSRYNAYMRKYGKRKRKEKKLFEELDRLLGRDD